MQILHVCPAACATGGPEAIHAFVHELNKIDGVQARIWYWGDKNNPCPAAYKAYNCEYVTEFPEGYNGALIVPEIWANHVPDYPQCKRAIYWLGVDAYVGWTPSDHLGDFLEDDGIVHIVQSEYAKDFLQKLGVKNLVKCTDYLNADFYADYEETERSDVVLYNPAKSTKFMDDLIEACSGIEFKQIQGMTRDEVIKTMRSSKLYVDFGEFPGRERMPREAVLCGCCIITSKVGSAAYLGDFLHDYKYDSKRRHIWAIVRKIKYVLQNYDECKKDFDLFRDALKADRDNIGKQCADVVRSLEEAT